MQQTTEPSVAPIPPGASKRADQSNPRWPYRLFGCLWLLGTIAVQFWLGWNLSQIGHSLDGPAFAVAGVGLGLGLLGSATFWAVGKLRVSSFESVAVPLAIGAVALAMAGAIWVEPDIGFGVLIAGALVLVVFAMLAAHKIRALATVVVVVALAAGVALLPSAVPALQDTRRRAAQRSCHQSRTVQVCFGGCGPRIRTSDLLRRLRLRGLRSQLAVPRGRLRLSVRARNDHRQRGGTSSVSTVSCILTGHGGNLDQVVAVSSVQVALRTSQVPDTSPFKRIDANRVHTEVWVRKASRTSLPGHGEGAAVVLWAE